MKSLSIFKAKVIEVIDGDTFKGEVNLSDNKPYKYGKEDSKKLKGEEHGRYKAYFSHW